MCNHTNLYLNKYRSEYVFFQEDYFNLYKLVQNKDSNNKSNEYFTQAVKSPLVLIRQTTFGNIILDDH